MPDAGGKILLGAITVDCGDDFGHYLRVFLDLLNDVGFLSSSQFFHLPNLQCGRARARGTAAPDMCELVLVR
eukprot:7486402-Lingulodinium_polyedra.AAC.1